MKYSFIATVFNEEKTIELLLKSLASQTKQVDEIIMVDGGSTDSTLDKIFNFQFPRLPKPGTGGQAIFNKKPKLKMLVKKGNRAVGRNEAIRNATGDIILCSDAGCVLDKNWVENITRPFKDSKVDVVAGYYKGVGNTVFEKSLIPYVLVMEDKVDPNNFLPATRSMAFKKSVWEKIGGFPEEFSYNEDYVFARKLRQGKFTILFKKDAIVYWFPRKNIPQAFIMFLHFAYGDAQARIIRPKVILIMTRYIVALGLLLTHEYEMLFFLFVFYILWSIVKNYRYVKKIQALYILPTLQLVSDFAVIIGTVLGFIKSVK